MGNVYRWTNRINGKMYIGSHNGNNPRYTGSGILFRLALKKYGIENFFKEILYEGDQFRAKEKEFLIAVDAAASPQYYNLKNDAFGGTFNGELNGMWRVQHTKETRIKISKALLGRKRPDQSLRVKGKNNPMFGQIRHTHGLKKYSTNSKGKTVEEIHGEINGRKIREKISQSHAGAQKTITNIKCPCCGIIGASNNMVRYHFENCQAVACIACREMTSLSLLGSRHYRCFREKFNLPKKSIAGENNPMFGKSHTEEAKEKISARNKGKMSSTKHQIFCIECHKQSSLSSLTRHNKCWKNYIEKVI